MFTCKLIITIINNNIDPLCKHGPLIKPNLTLKKLKTRKYVHYLPSFKHFSRQKGETVAAQRFHDITPYAQPWPGISFSFSKAGA